MEDSKQTRKVTSSPVIVVQGGAGTYSKFLESPAHRARLESELAETARCGHSVLAAGGSALDAVEAAVVCMEDSPNFNAGKGSYLTEDKTIEMDACIMDGATLKAGSVVCITNVTNPIKVARLVMEKSPHVLLVGEGARRFATKMGVQPVSDQELMTPKAEQLFEKTPTFNPTRHMHLFDKRESDQSEERKTVGDRDEHDTVGAVALDKDGNLAFATSTGGMTCKMVGRAGDSGIPGCGGYADNDSGAISTTGHGESFLKTCAARHVSFLIEQGESPQKAIERALQYMLDRVNGRGGCIALDRHGNVGIHFTYEGMQWAAIKDGQLHHGIYAGEWMTETL